VIATIDTYDSSARARSGAALAVVVVVLVEYRKGPEHKYLAAHDDAYAASLGRPRTRPASTASTGRAFD
jgi:acetyl esterase